MEVRVMSAWWVVLAALGALSACARTGFVMQPCEAQVCSGRGRCGVTADGDALCACDPGYRNAGPLACVLSMNSDASTPADSAPPDRDPSVEAGAPDAARADSQTPDVAATDRGLDAAATDAATPDGAVPVDARIADSAQPTDTAPGVDTELSIDAGGALDSAPGQDAHAGDSAVAVDAAVADAASVDAGGLVPDAGVDADAACLLFHPVPLPAEVRADPVNDFWGAGPEDLRAVTASGSVLHWDGCTMHAEHKVATPLKGIWGSSASDIWAVGSGDAVLRYNGSTWSELIKPATSDLRDVWGSSADDLWFVGTPIGATTFYALRWSSGAGFDEPRIQNIEVETPMAVWGSAADDVWIVGYFGIVRHNGNRFNQFEYNYIAEFDICHETNYRAIWGYDVNDIDIAGRSWSWSISSGSYYARGTKRWNGVDLVSNFLSGNGTLYSVHGSSPTNRWRVGTVRLVQTDQGAGWTTVNECGGPPPVTFNEVYAFAPDDVWFSALGAGVYHYCGGASRDSDGDGHPAAVCGGDDCDDCVGAINPGVLEGPALSAVCTDGVDNDCDGQVDGADEGCW